MVNSFLQPRIIAKIVLTIILFASPVNEIFFVQSRNLKAQPSPSYVNIEKLMSGDIFNDCSILELDTFCPDMVILPPGNFLKGNVIKNIDTFSISQTEITYGQWNRFVKSTNFRSETCSGSGNFSPSESNFTAIHPITCINFNDIQEYIAWLNKNLRLVDGETKGVYRLPNEDEWEYAALLGNGERYWNYEWEKICDYENLPDEKLLHENPNIFGYNVNCDDGYVFSAPVKSFMPNSYFLYDMLGNVREWVEEYHYGANNGKLGIVLGGSWSIGPGQAPFPARSTLNPRMRMNDVGFRLVRTLPFTQ